LYYLYIGGTSEDEELLKEMADPGPDGEVNVFNFAYDENTGEFINQYYRELVSTVGSDLTAKGRPPELIAEFIRNAQAGALSADWLITEEDCLKKIKSAARKEDKNYFIAMLLLIRRKIQEQKPPAEFWPPPTAKASDSLSIF
jgi:hypothetical protein